MGDIHKALFSEKSLNETTTYFLNNKAKESVGSLLHPLFHNQVMFLTNNPNIEIVEVESLSTFLLLEQTVKLSMKDNIFAVIFKETQSELFKYVTGKRDEFDKSVQLFIYHFNEDFALTCINIQLARLTSTGQPMVISGSNFAPFTVERFLQEKRTLFLNEIKNVYGLEPVETKIGDLCL